MSADEDHRFPTKERILNIYRISGGIMILVNIIRFISFLNIFPNPLPHIDLYFLKNIIEYIANGMLIGAWALTAYYVTFRREQLRERFGELEPAKRLNMRFNLALYTAVVSIFGLAFHEIAVLIWMTMSIQFFICILAIDTYLRHSSSLNTKN